MTDLVAAARFEVASREKQYPGSVASGTLTAAEATHDFQAWHCIAEFLDSGRSPVGWFDADAGAAIQADCRVVVEWLLMEDAVTRAIGHVADALADAAAQHDDAKVDRLTQRQAALQLISRQVTQQRLGVERLNRLVKEQRARLAQQQEAA